MAVIVREFSEYRLECGIAKKGKKRIYKLGHLRTRITRKPRISQMILYYEAAEKVTLSACPE